MCCHLSSHTSMMCSLQLYVRVVNVDMHFNKHVYPSCPVDIIVGDRSVEEGGKEVRTSFIFTP